MAETNSGKPNFFDKAAALSLFKIRGRNVPTPNEDPLNKYEYVNMFKESELRHLPGVYDGKNTNKRALPISSIEKLLSETGENTRGQIKSNTQFKQLTPEIDQARDIRVLSIISPNDMSNDKIQIEFTVDKNVLNAECQNTLNEMITTFWNDKLKLNTKLPKWIGEAMFETGATPVLVVPRSSIRTMSELSALEAEAKARGEEFHVSQETLSVGLSDGPTDVSPVVDVASLDETIASISTVDLHEDISNILELSDMEITNEAVKQVTTSTIKHVKGLISANSATILFSSDFRDIATGKKTAVDANKKMLAKLQRSIFGTDSKRIFALDGDGDVESGDVPTITKLPTSSVIPIPVPGDASEHVAYLILTDEHGHPLRDDVVPPKDAGELLNFPTGQANKLSSEDRMKVSESVFGVTMRKILERKLDGEGISGVDISQSQAISNTLFYNLMRQHKVRIVYVPANLISYFAFDYRPDGTGKSLLEGNEFILSMRSTLLIANTLAGIKNASENKRIEFTVDEDSADNIEQLVDIITNMFVSKRMLKTGVDGHTTTKDLLSRSIDVVPQGIPGLGDFSISTDTSGGNSTQPDTDLIELLTSYIVNILGVPHAALNALGEDEYSRSVATTNLFFSNTIRADQRTVAEPASKLVQQYTMMSGPLMAKIYEIIKANSSDAAKSIGDDDIARIIRSIRVTFPTPNIAMNRAQFEEIGDAVDALGSVMDVLYNDDMLAVEYEGASEAFSAARASIHAKLLGDLIDKIGASGMPKLDTLYDVDNVDLLELNQRMINLAAGLASVNKVMTAEED